MARREPSRWMSLVCDERGRLSRAKVEKMLDDVARVYDHVSGGRINIPTAPATEVIAVATAVDDEALQAVLADEKQRWQQSCAQSERVTDVAYVKLGGKAVTVRGRHVRVCVPEGEFMCVYDQEHDQLLVDDANPLPLDWRETAVNAARVLVKEEPAVIFCGFPRLEAIKETT